MSRYSTKATFCFGGSVATFLVGSVIETLPLPIPLGNLVAVAVIVTCPSLWLLGCVNYAAAKGYLRSLHRPRWF